MAEEKKQIFNGNESEDESEPESEQVTTRNGSKNDNEHVEMANGRFRSDSINAIVELKSEQDAIVPGIEVRPDDVLIIEQLLEYEYECDNEDIDERMQTAAFCEYVEEPCNALPQSTFDNTEHCNSTIKAEVSKVTIDCLPQYLSIFPVPEDSKKDKRTARKIRKKSASGRNEYEASSSDSGEIIALKSIDEMRNRDFQFPDDTDGFADVEDNVKDSQSSEDKDESSDGNQSAQVRSPSQQVPKSDEWKIDKNRISDYRKEEITCISSSEDNSETIKAETAENSETDSLGLFLSSRSEDEISTENEGTTSANSLISGNKSQSDSGKLSDNASSFFSSFGSRHITENSSPSDKSDTTPIQIDSENRSITRKTIGDVTKASENHSSVDLTAIKLSMDVTRKKICLGSSSFSNAENMPKRRKVLSEPGNDKKTGKGKMATIHEATEENNQNNSEIAAPSVSKTNPLKMKSSVIKRKDRCNVCNSKLGLCGIGCRCGGYYCHKHRYHTEHNCTFDYKSMGAEEIRKNNPQVIAEKLNKL